MTAINTEHRAASPTVNVEYVVSSPYTVATVPKVLIDQALTMMGYTRMYELQPDELPVITSIVSDLLNYESGERYAHEDNPNGIGSFEQINTTRTWTPQYDLLREHLEFRQKLSQNGKMGSLRRNESIPNDAIQPNGTIDIRVIRLKEKSVAALQRTAGFLLRYAMGELRISERTTKRYGRTVYDGEVIVPDQSTDNTEQQEQRGEVIETVKLAQSVIPGSTGWIDRITYGVAENLVPPTQTTQQEESTHHRTGWTKTVQDGFNAVKGVAGRFFKRNGPSSSERPFNSTGKRSSADRPFEAFS